MDTPQPPPADAKSDDTPLQTQVVNNIPIHTAASPAAPASAQPTDENKIMRAVGDQIAKEDQSKPKNHFFSKPAEQPKPPQPPARTAQPPASAQKPAAKPVANQPVKPKSSMPIMAITITVLITGVLIFLAYSALK